MNARELLRQFGYKPKKRLGQHFLNDAGAARRIASLALQDIAPGTRVLEIGPGTGTLTRALAESGADLTALEIDSDMLQILRSREDLQGVHLIGADALAFDYENFAQGKAWRIAGNLPYNIATPLILRFIEMPNGPQLLAVMVQKDVAARFAAQPATKAYGSLSVAVQYGMQVRRAFTLASSAFYPRPRVDSTVVVLSRRPQPAVEVTDEKFFLKVVRAAFAYRRKTLANSVSLALNMDRERCSKILQQLGYPTEVRGEQLSLADFARISDRLSA